MPNKMPSILVGALVLTVISVLSSVTIGQSGAVAQTVGCLTLLVAAIVAVAHYTSTNRLTLTAGQGASLGVMATVLGLVLAFAISYLLQLVGVTPTFEEVMEMEMARQRESLAARGMSQDEIDQALAMGASMSSPLIAVGISMVLGTIVGAITGAVSALVFKKGEAA